MKLTKPVIKDIMTVLCKHRFTIGEASQRLTFLIKDDSESITYGDMFKIMDQLRADGLTWSLYESEAQNDL